MRMSSRKTAKWCGVVSLAEARDDGIFTDEAKLREQVFGGQLKKKGV